MKKEIPILFSTPMVQAILSGRKTMTRRIIKPQPDPEGSVSLMKNPPLNWEGIWYPWFYDTADGEGVACHCPYGMKGNILWVRETFAYTQFAFDKSLIAPRGEYGVVGSEIFRADKENSDWDGKWNPNIFMPKEVCRIWLEVTGIKAERLQDISEEDAKAEGVERWTENKKADYKYVFHIDWSFPLYDSLGYGRLIIDKPKRDTVKAIMMISNIYKPELWSIRGYVITERWGSVIGYLDKKKRPLPKYIYVWLLKSNY